MVHQCWADGLRCMAVTNVAGGASEWPARHRAAPAESNVAQAASQIFMNDTGPDATLPVRPALKMRHAPVGPSTSENASTRKKLEIVERHVERLCPDPALGLDRRDRTGDTIPGVRNRTIRCITILPIAVFGLPDVLGDGSFKLRHWLLPQLPPVDLG